MKRKIKILLILIGGLISSLIFINQASAQQANVSFQEFYDQLSPYGEWVDHPDWGYIWLPDAGEDFVPYSTAGHWVLSNYGWTWVSDYDWGWAAFHYGRWDYDNYYGWFWVPDNEWGPAWVTWRSATGYYGWAPMRPGVSINLSFGSRYNSNLDHWMFVRDRDLDRYDINRYFVNRYDYDRILLRSRVINRSYFDSRRNSTYIYGPARADVQRVFGRIISLFTIFDYDRPGHNIGNGRLQMYRPQVRRYDDHNKFGGIDRGRNDNRKPAPARVIKREDVRRPSERNSHPQRNQTYQPQNDNRPRNVNPPPSNIRRNVNPSQPGVRTNHETPQMQRDQRDQPQRNQPQRVQRDQPQSTQPQRVQKDQPQKVTPPSNPQRRTEPPQRSTEPTRQRVDPPQRSAEPTRQRVDPPQRRTETTTRKEVPVQRKAETTQRKEEPARPQRTRSEREKTGVPR